MTKHLLIFLKRTLMILAFLSARVAFAGGDNNFYIYSNVYGGFEPWYTTANSDAMNTVFGIGGWTQDYFETCDPSFIFSANTNFVFLEGSDGFADELESFLTTNITIIEDWVNDGGRLLLNAAPNEGDGMSFGFGDVNLTYWGGSSQVTSTDPTHPIFNEPYTPTGLDWTGSSFSHASVSGADLTPLIVDSFSPTTVAYSEGRYGAEGIVGFGGMTTNNFHYPSTESVNLFQNIIYYLAFYVVPNHDIASLSLVSPTNGCGLGVESVTVNFKNYGLNDEVNIPVSYQLDGGTVISETIAGPIAAGATYTHTFAVPADLSVIGSHSIIVNCDLPLDEDLGNNTLTVSVENVPVVSSFPYYEDFEDGAAGWLAEGAASTWELGDPAGFSIIGPPDATPASLNSWTTSLTGYYNNDEKSMVTSPCLDMSSLVFPYLEMDINWDIQEYSDGAKVQYSTDAGYTWSDLGSVGDGDNWFNSFTCYSMWPTFYITDYRGWNGNSFGWKHAYIDLSFLGGESSVKIRVIFAADSYWNFNDGFAFDNFKIADLFPNDVGVSSIYQPNSGPSLTAAEPISVVIKNYGTLAQSGFPVSYQMDGGAVVTETFTGTVEPGLTAIHYFASTEDLSVLGDYEFTAWTSLPTDEDNTNDEITETVSKLLPITGTSAYYVYSNTTGGEPWYTTTNSAAMDAVYGVGEWTLEYFETLDPALVFGSGTCFVFLEGSDGHALELEAFLATNIGLIEDWVASGGHLFLNAAPNEGSGMDFGFDDTQLFYPYFTGLAEATAPIHPIFDGPFTPTATSMSGGSYGHANVTGTDWTPILHDYYAPDKIVCAEKSWGAGIVIFGGMTTTYFHYPSPEGNNFRQNLISYLGTCTISDNDVGVNGATSPASACGLSATEDVTVTVKNYGFLAQTDVPVNYQINGGTTITEIVPGTIGVGETVTYTFATTANLSIEGTYNIDVWSTLALDTIYSNDSTDFVVDNVPTITSFPYYQDFELGSGGWIAAGSGSTWELGAPAGFVINTPPPATPSSQYSWDTNLEGYYNNNEKSYVTSPCLDFSTLVLPYIEFDINYDIQLYSDGAKMQYTTDGVTWSDLGNVGEGENWYDSYNCYSMWPTFYITDYRGWQNTGVGWKHAYYDMSFLAGQPYVRLRMVFAADSYWNFNDGIAFDNVRIQDPYDNDLGVIDLVSPVSGPSLTTSEVVTVTVRNFGTFAQSGFPVSYQADGGAVVTETFLGTIEPGTSEPFTFAGTADLSLLGLHEICAWTGLVGDEDPTNDEIPGCKVVANLAPISGTGTYYIYSSAVGYEPGYLNSNSTAMDEVFGAGAWILDYYEAIDPYAVFSNENCFIFLEGSESHWSEFETFFGNNKELIEGWVSSGGNLFINASPWEGDGGDVGFGGVTVSYPYYTYYTEATEPLHPVLSGPFTPVSADLYGFYIGYARTVGDITPIINDLYCADCYLLGEKEWGDGRVMFGNMSAPEYYTPTDESQNLRQNIIDYLKLCAPVDLGVVEITSPEGGCGMGLEEITITVENFGPSGVSSFPVKYQVDGGGIESAFAAVTIDAGDTETYTFDVSYDFSATGTYDICVWTDFSGDSDESNDMLCITITSLATPSVDLGPNMTVCDIVTLDAENIGNTYLWSTGATTQTIDVTVSGTYSVTITNPTTGCAFTDEVAVTVNYTPAASFTYSATGLTVSFTNTSTDGATYNWSFGDGGTSTTANPSHTYAVEGAYTVTLTVTNGCGTDFYSVVIEVGTDINTITLADAVTVQPNPTSDFTNVSINLNEATSIKLELVNSLGQVVWSNTPTYTLSATYVIDMTMYAEGVYQLNIISADAMATKPIVLVK